MHDDRTPVEARPERGARAAGPVRVARAGRTGAGGPGLAGRPRAVRVRHGVGKALVDELVPVGGPGAGGVGIQAEGLLYDSAGVPLKGIHPRNRHLPVASPASGGEGVRLLPQDGRQSGRPARLRAYATGCRPDRRRWAHLPIPLCRPRRTRRTGVAVGPRRRGAVGADARDPGGPARTHRLGVDTEEIWLPDSFGCMAAFPQLAKLAGIRWFLTPHPGGLGTTVRLTLLRGPS